jgi:hypothetical protein
MHVEGNGGAGFGTPNRRMRCHHGGATKHTEQKWHELRCEPRVAAPTIPLRRMIKISALRLYTGIRSFSVSFPTAQFREAHMPSLRSYCFSLILIPLLASSADAQLGGRLGRKISDAVERKAEQKIDQKIEEAAERWVNRSFDAMFAEDTTGAKQSGKSGKSGGSRLFNFIPNAPTEPRYDFDVVFNYEIESTPKGKPAETGVMMMHFNTAGQYAGTRFMAKDAKKEDGELFVIFDVKNQSMVMLMTNEDGKFSMAYGWKDAGRYASNEPTKGTVSTSTAVATGAAATPTVTYTSIGKRTIAGYSAEGYRAEDADGIVDVWVSTDPSLSYGRLMGASGSLKQVRSTMPASHPAGMLLETLTTDKRTGDKGRMTVTKVQKNAGVKIDMSEYPKVGSKTESK